MSHQRCSSKEPVYLDSTKIVHELSDKQAVQRKWQICNRKLWNRTGGHEKPGLIIYSSSLILRRGMTMYLTAQMSIRNAVHGTWLDNDRVDKTRNLKWVQVSIPRYRIIVFSTSFLSLYLSPRFIGRYTPE